LKSLGEDCQYTRYSAVRCKTQTHIERERGERGGERERKGEREREKKREVNRTFL